MREGLHFSKLLPFSCFKSQPSENHGLIGQKGYSRVVYCNDPDNPEAIKLNYRGNYVSNTKYTALNFIPKSLFEQFRRVANFYFLVVACVSISPLAPYTAPSVAVPLLVVIGATMAKEGIEDWRRRKQVILLFLPPSLFFFHFFAPCGCWCAVHFFVRALMMK
jgi:phospholipid-translocating ATPase